MDLVLMEGSKIHENLADVISAWPPRLLELLELPPPSRLSNDSTVALQQGNDLFALCGGRYVVDNVVEMPKIFLNRSISLAPLWAIGTLAVPKIQLASSHFLT